MAGLTRTGPDFFDDIHKTSLQQPLLIIKRLLQVTANGQPCLDHYLVQPLQVCAVQGIVVAQRLEDGIHELNPAPWLHVIIRLPDDSAVVVEAADCETQMHVIEWLWKNPVRVLRIFFEELHVRHDVS